MTAGILFGILFLMLFVGVPIAICLGIATAVTMIVSGNLHYLAAIPTRMFTQLDSSTLMAVPFFILAGNIMDKAQISKRLIRLAETCVGHLRGGLAIVCVIVSCFFAAISGSGPATVAALGLVMIPGMIRSGYSPSFSAALMGELNMPDDGRHEVTMPGMMYS